MRAPSIENKLGNPKYFEREIVALHQKSHSVRWNVHIYDELSLAAAYRGRRKLARALAQEVKSGQYRFETATIRKIFLQGKKRDVFIFSLMDRIVHGALTRILSEELLGQYSDNLHSFQKGKSGYDAICGLARYLRRHQAQVRVKRQRGIYVLRRDISAYTDRIPVHAGAPVWRLLSAALTKRYPQGSAGGCLLPLLQQIIRPELVSRHGAHYSLIQGVPTGSPITAILYNLCAIPLDEELACIEGGFYARYCDDFIFAHPDIAVAKKAHTLISDTLASLGLHSNFHKEETFFCNGAGRSSESWKALPGSQFITYLGCRIGFDGTVSLKTERTRRFLRDIRSRVKRTAALIPGALPQQSGPVICAMLNKSFNPSSPFRQKYAQLFRYLITDRRHLREIDYWIALRVAETISGIEGARAFRKIPYRLLRREWGLHSLCHARDAV